MEAATTLQRPPDERAVSSFAQSLFLGEMRMVAIAKLAYRRGEYGYALFTD